MKYSWDDRERILELIKSFNHCETVGYIEAVNLAIEQYDYFKHKMEEANKNDQMDNSGISR